MDIIESPNDAGLNSLSGFSYQIKVFILKMTQLKENQQVEFETLDDVATRSLSADNTVTDFCIKRYVAAESSGIEVFQVKQTDVTKSVARKVLYNWLLAYNENSDITSFHLYVDCQQLKLKSLKDGKRYKTDVADTERLLRIIQSIPSPKAGPFKRWLAEVGRERIEETIDPELTIDRALETYLKKDTLANGLTNACRRSKSAKS